MPLTLALHHEQNMPAVKSKIHPAPSHTWKCTKSCFIYMCNVWQVSGCKWKSRRLFGRSRTVKYGLFRWGGGVGGGRSLQSVQMERFLNREVRSDVCVWNHLVSAEWITRWVVRLCVCCLQASQSDFLQGCASPLCPEESPAQGFFSLGTKDKHSGDASDQDQRIFLSFFFFLSLKE